MRFTPVLASLAGVLLLAACGATETPSAAPAAASGAVSGTASTTGVTELKTTTTALGDVVSDGSGMTLYMFTKDAKDATSSACTGECLVTWPPAIAGPGLPQLKGVTGKVGTIDTEDGRKQLTLSGWPLHYFAKDEAPGAVLGQGIDGVWYVLDAAGNPVKTTVDIGSPGGGY